jgi:hypothetical protein
MDSSINKSIWTYLVLSNDECFTTEQISKYDN